MEQERIAEQSARGRLLGEIGDEIRRTVLESEGKDRLLTIWRRKAVTIMGIVESHGYTRPEPDGEKVEAIAKLIYDTLGNAHLTWNTCNVQGKYRALARSILSLLSPVPELTLSLQSELRGMKPDYQDKLAHLLNTASAMGEWDGESYGELAVINPRTLEIVMREKDAAPLSHDIDTLKGKR